MQSGSAALVRDNGFNFGVEMKPNRYVDLEAGYSQRTPAAKQFLVRRQLRHARASPP